MAFVQGASPTKIIKDNVVRDVLDLPPGKAQRALFKRAKFKSAFSARIGKTCQRAKCGVHYGFDGQGGNQ